MRRVREDCCDDLLLDQELSSPDECCGTLLAVARHQTNRHTSPLAVTMAASHPLAARLTRIMDDSLVRQTRLSRYSVGVLTVLALLCLPGLRRATSAPEKLVEPTNAQVLHGRVADMKGSPVAGSRLLVTMELPFDEGPGENIVVVARGTSDGQGRFRIEVDKSNLEGAGTGFLGGRVHCWLCFHVWVEGISWSVA